MQGAFIGKPKGPKGTGTTVSVVFFWGDPGRFFSWDDYSLRSFLPNLKLQLISLSRTIQQNSKLKVLLVCLSDLYKFWYIFHTYFLCWTLIPWFFPMNFHKMQGLCLLGQVRRPGTALDLDWRLRFGAWRLQGPGLGWRCALGADTNSQGSLKLMEFLEMAQDLEKEDFCMEISWNPADFQESIGLSVVNFGWMNLNLLQDFTRCWLCMSFAW